ncbi:calcium-binding protein [Pseudooceanicola sp.]|uniref:calcium-binding protein n=1 Tax=Pseudooceanicola sp. TaxID=1914328 RepID=UPI0040593F25
MALSHSQVSDNELLTFGTPTGMRVPDGYRTTSTYFDLTGIFSSGLSLGDQTFTGLRVHTDGTIQFANGGGWQNTYINAFYNRYIDTRIKPDGVSDPGIWIDANSDRDSVVITWNAVAERYGRSLFSTFQVEIRDLGDSDAEVIFRYNDMRGSVYTSRPAMSLDGTNYALPTDRMGPEANWEIVTGNTGVDGVWQIRVEDGVPDLDDFATPFRNLQGTAGDDTLSGWLGTDILRGLEGDDLLTGDRNNDTMTGDAGNDTLIGGAGDDVIFGGDGHDDIRGGDGDNTVAGGEGDDTISAGDGSNTIHGGEGANRIIGGQHSDYITTGSGNDAIDAREGDDTVNAGDGDDTVIAGQGQDTVHGGAGDDLIVVGGSSWGNNFLTGDSGHDFVVGSRYEYGNDTLLGGDGNDTLDGAEGRNTLSGGDGDDVLRASYTTSSYDYYNRNLMNGGEGNDNIIGANGRDTLGGQGGDDHIEGREGNDSIGAGDGADTVLGGAGHDFIYGGAGADSLSGGIGDDTVFGGEGDDTLLGGDGSDELLGGDGDDFVFGGAGGDFARGGAGADRFFASSEANDVTVIHDYNPDEGDWLILSPGSYTRSELRLLGDRLTDLDGQPAEYRNLSLIAVDENRELMQTIFTFTNATELDRLIIRMPDGTDAPVETLYLDLF